MGDYSVYVKEKTKSTVTSDAQAGEWLIKICDQRKK